MLFALGIEHISFFNSKDLSWGNALFFTIGNFQTLGFKFYSKRQGELNRINL
jgi:hypothetical protein